MINTFKEYTPLDTDEIKDLWKNALFIFDTNVLLNLYRYSDETSIKIIEIIEKLENIWIPYQVGLEFHRRRLGVISEQKKNYSDFEGEFKKIILAVEDKNRCPFFSPELLEKLNDLKKEIGVEVKSKSSYFDDLLKNDALLERINVAFSEKVGCECTPEELKTIYSEGDKRYKENIPPGYKDNAKPGNSKFGDLIVWKEILKKANLSSKDVIFITDDRKEDWWLEHKGQTISARPELLKEFNKETNKKCHFYQPFQFLEFSNKYLHSKIEKDIIEEVKNYKPEISIKERIEILLILTGNAENIDNFVNMLLQTGYNIRFNPTDLFNVTIILPDVPDLERRFKEKYLQNVEEFGIKLVAVNVERIIK
jgi:hypothetical protein